MYYYGQNYGGYPGAYQYPVNNTGGGFGGVFAIILVLFILLVIIGCGCNNKTTGCGCNGGF